MAWCRLKRRYVNPKMFPQIAIECEYAKTENIEQCKDCKKHMRQYYKRVQPTSIEAFYNEEFQKGLIYRQQQVFKTLQKLVIASNREISIHVSLPINSVTPRMCELRDMGVVEFAGHAHDKVTNRKVMLWKIADKEKIKDLYQKKIGDFDE